MDFHAPENIFHGGIEASVVDTPQLSSLGHELLMAAQVANVAERDAYFADWMEENGEPTTENPCIVWRADGSVTGVLEAISFTWGMIWWPITTAVGTVRTSLATHIGIGWELCDGRLIPSGETTLPAVWEQLPALREGTGIRLPDLRARTQVGAGPRLTAGKPGRSVGATGGAEEVLLSQDQTPLVGHVHGLSDFNQKVLAAFRSLKGFWGIETGPTLTGTGRSYQIAENRLARNDSITFTYGSGAEKTEPATRDALAAHENMPPFYAVNYFMKV